MRLYRGLKRPYRAEDTAARSRELQGADFTDCPATALSYASGQRGVLLIVEVPAHKVTEELWFDTGARRLMVWGRFEEYIVASIPAKDLRREVRKRQLFGARLPVEYFIEKRLASCHRALTESGLSGADRET